MRFKALRKHLKTIYTFKNSIIMTQSSNLTSQPHQISLVKRMLAGAGMGLLLISLFLLSAGEPNPEWGKQWIIRPLIIVPLAGALQISNDEYNYT